MAIGGSVPALAHEGHGSTGDTSDGEAGDYSITLDELNGSGASGTAMITLAENGDLTVMVEASGLTPGQPHAQHIHGNTDLTDDFTCPTSNADADGDGIVSTSEGVPSYGDIHISLTTEGDSSPDSGLAVDRFPAADDDGNVNYERTFSSDELPEGTAAAVRNLHVVQHGVDFNGNGEYDNEAGPSDLDPSLPQEATAPASCGLIEGSNISDVPGGGVDTGSGPLAGSAHDHGSTGVTISSTLVGTGLATMIALGVVASVRRRSSVQ